MSLPQDVAIELAGVRIAPGQSRSIEIPVARMYTHAEVNLPVRVICGKRKGPRLFVSAAIHGDEILGVEIVRQLQRSRLIRNLRGVLVLIPVVNVHGFLGHSRYLPDRRDLNRSFPGLENGSLTARLAWLFMKEIAEKCTHGIDLHTGANHRFNLPQIRADLSKRSMVRLAKAFGAPVILDASVRSGSMREAVTALGKPVLLYEAGEAHRYDKYCIRIGVNGILSVMHLLGMIEKAPTSRISVPFVAKSSVWVRAPQSGIFRSKLALGATIRRGENIGFVCDAFGENEVKVLAPEDGIVICLNKLPLVNKGDALFHLARHKGGIGPDDLSLPEDFVPYSAV